MQPSMVTRWLPAPSTVQQPNMHWAAQPPPYARITRGERRASKSEALRAIMSSGRRAQGRRGSEDGISRRTSTVERR